MYSMQLNMTPSFRYGKASLFLLLNLLSNFQCQPFNDATLIPLTIFHKDRNWVEAVKSCNDDFGVRLATSSFALQHLKHVVEEGVVEAKVLA